MRVLEVERCAEGECPWRVYPEGLDLWGPLDPEDYCTFGRFRIAPDIKTFPKNCPLKKVKK